MASSLAAQLSLGVSLNKSLLVDRTRRRPTESYLFSSREADKHDLDAIHALGVNALSKLKTVEPLLGLYEDALFSDAAKSKDRTLQTAETNAELDRAIEGFLTLLGPYLLEETTGKTIEWMVRRFRINEFNVEAVLAIFFPYHEAPHFQKMLSILHIKHATKFSPLLPFRSTTTPLTHNALINVMVQPANTDLARFIAGLLPAVVKLPNAPNALHRALVALHTGVLFEFIRRTFGSRGKGKNAAVDEGTVAWVLVAASEPLQICTVSEVERSKESIVSEVVLSSYLLLSAIAHTCLLSAKAFNAVLKTIAACATRVSANQVVRTYASVYAGQDAEVTNERPLPKSVTKALLQLPDVVTEIQGVFSYVGTERFVSAFGQALVTRIDETHAFNALNALVMSPSLPSPTVKDLALLLIRSHIGGAEQPDQNETAPAIARSILVHIQQRHPAALQEVFESMLEDAEFVEKKEAVEQLLLSLSVALPVSGAVDADMELDTIVASTSADAPVRVIAVRKLYETLLSSDLPESERTSIRSALLTRVQDSNTAVVDALYASPAEFLTLVLTDPAAYITTLTQLLPTAGKATITSHIGFVVAHLYPALVSEGSDSKDLAFDLIVHVLFPFLLFTKSRQKTTAAVWELVEAADSESGVARAELLAGCIDAVRWEEQKGAGQTSGNSQGASKEDGSQNTAMMARVNIAIASKIADNVFVSASFEKYFGLILEKMRDTNAYARALGYLICRAILARLSGDRLINSAHRVLASMGLNTLEGMDEFLRSTDNLQAFFHDLSLSTAVVVKPSKLHTLHRLQVAILINVPTIPRPAGAPLDWLMKTSAMGSEEDTNASRYIALMRAVYTLANSTASLPSLSIELIRMLFLNVGDDALNFLVGIWLHSSTSTTAGPAGFAALRHAAAFLEAHFATQRWVDFQTIVPAFLVALQHGHKRMREGALECVSALVRLSQAPKPTGIYAFDAIYGASSADLQYLEWSDFCRYVQALQASKEHILNDPDYLRVFHQQHLAAVAFEPKKDSMYKQHVLCYLLSHVVGCPIPEVKISLLNTVKEISSKAKSQVLQPVIEALSSDTATQMVQLFGASYDEFASSVVASIDETAVEALNNPDGLWGAYQAALRYYFRPGASSMVKSVLSQKLQTSVFSLLQFERKVELCRMLLELGQENNVANDCRTLLTSVLNDVPVIVRLLTDLQPAPVDAERANKRAKVDQAKDNENYTMLVLLAETLSSKPLPGSVELVSCLLETLNKVIHDATSSATDKSYNEQLLMTAIENAATHVPSGRPTSSVRLDVLVESIRVSDNPQTFNQALLLMATLARLSPEAVLHNVMPVFTFMGSNVFHRDDAYSFRVVQKTIDSIVPVMVSSLKESPLSSLDLYISSRSFLRIFTDAANHIPRHRRTNFFGHLIDVLGAEDFLAPVCMLLVDKSANRVVRQNSEESLNSLSLPLSALHRYGKNLQLVTLVEVLREVQRLVEQGLQLEISVKTFLESQQDEERSAQPSVKRQAAALLIFVSQALKQLLLTPASPNTEHSNTELLPILLDIAVSKVERLATAGMENIPALAGDIVKDALQVMPATNFFTGVLAALNSGNSNIQKGAMELFSEQLTNVATKVRQDSKVVIGKIVDAAKKLLTTSPETLAVAALHVLRAIADSMIPGEEHALTGAVPPVLKAVSEIQTTLPALEVLWAQSHKLGPRLIPYFKEMIRVCSSVVRSHGESETVGSKAVGVLQGLLTSIPNFWSSSEFLQVINLYLDICGSSTKSQVAPLSSLIKTVAKKAPSKLLLATLCDVWPSLNTEPVIPKLEGYFSVLKRAIHVADRSVVSDNTRTLFKVFMESFDLFAMSSPIREAVQDDSVAAFIEVIVKLNETAFKPLFRRMFDWAFSSDKSEIGIGKRLVFCRVYMSLVGYFKNLITPYMSFLLEPFGDTLRDFTKSSNQELWLTIVNTITKSITLDEGAFWRDDKLQRLLSPVVAQVPIAARFHDAEKTAFSDCLVAFADTLNDDSLLKSFNMDLLMHTRSEEARVRLYALTCSEALWRSQGEKFIGFSAETATFIAECAEDDNDSVAREAHRLKNAVETVAGRIEV